MDRIGHRSSSVTIVERFLAFNDWPASHKVLLLGCLSSPTTLLAAAVNQMILSSPNVPAAVNLQLLNPFLMVWLVVQVAVTLLAWVGVRTGSRNGAFAYLYAAMNVPFIGSLLT